MSIRSNEVLVQNLAPDSMHQLATAMRHNILLLTFVGDRVLNAVGKLEIGQYTRSDYDRRHRDALTDGIYAI